MKVPEPRKLPSGTCFIQLRLSGVSVPVTASTKKECIRAAELIKAEHRAGKRALTSTGKNSTLSRAIDIYIGKRENILSASTVRGYRTIQRTRFQNIMNRPIVNIRWQAVINAEAGLCSAKTLRNSWSFVRSVLQEAGIDPGEVSLPALTPHEHIWLTPDQIPVFIEAVHGRPYEIAALLALSGLRLSELLGLDWGDIDLDARTIHIHRSRVVGADGQPVLQARNKNASSTRYVPIMMPQLYDALTAVAIAGRVGPVVAYHQNTLYKLIAARCEAVGLPNPGIHGLRHSFASLCYSLGIDEMTCMRLGGWSDFQTMRKIYTHLAEKSARIGVEKLADFFNKC